MRKLWVGLAATAVLALTGCGYNTIQSRDEQTKAAWSEVLNQYQRRADLVPNLVNTVKGYADQEQRVLIAVTEARAKVGTIQATPELINDPEAFARFQAAQRELSGALSKLLVVAENYPQLKSDANFRDLQAQLEGTENRITVARNRYIQAVQSYNVTVRSFPSNLTATVFGYKTKANFSVENEAEISKPPAVDFTRPPNPVSGNVDTPAVPAGASTPQATAAGGPASASPAGAPLPRSGAAAAPDVTSGASIVTSSAPEPSSRH